MRERDFTGKYQVRSAAGRRVGHYQVREEAQQHQRRLCGSVIWEWVADGERSRYCPEIRPFTPQKSVYSER